MPTTIKKKPTGRGTTKQSFKFKSKVIVWGGNPHDHSAWRFARVPERVSAKIKKMQEGRMRRGWGAVYAHALIRESEWQTSIFPDRHSATYVLPLKKSVRKAEGLYDDMEIKVSMDVWF
ncbi:MAG: DUF1905 domain-containing protein [bacterium]